MVKLVTILIVFVLVLPTAVSAQWTHTGNNADIRAMLMVDGVLWVGTNGGLIFVDPTDGSMIGHVRAGATLPDNSVRVIEPIRGGVFVGTDGGFSAFADRESTFKLGQWYPPILDVRSIVEGPSGTLYFGTFGHGVGVLEAKGFRWTRSPQDSLLDNKVYDIYETDALDVYYGTSLGLCAYADSAWVGFQAGAGLPRGEVLDMVPTGPEQFYALIGGRGVYRFKTNRGRRIRARDIFPEDEISAIAVDTDNRLWAAGRYGGIARFAGSKWTTLGAEDSLVTTSRWRSIYAAPDGQVFFGSAEGLILVASGDELRSISIPSVLPSGYVGPIAQSADGRRLIVSGPYLLSQKGDSDVFQAETEFGSVFAIAESPDGEVWVATPWGLFQKGNDGYEAVQPDIDPVMPVFVSLAFDGAGALWAGTQDGEVYRFSGDIWVLYAGRHDLARQPVRQIIIDGNRRVWVVSGRKQVHRYDGSKWTVFGHATFDSLDVTAMAVGPDGAPVVVTESSVWKYGLDEAWQPMQLAMPSDIGTLSAIHFDIMGRMFLGATNGLMVVAGGDTRWVGARDGLGGKDVTSVFVDAEDVLWVGFRRDGLSRISLEKLSP